MNKCHSNKIYEHKHIYLMQFDLTKKSPNSQKNK